MQGEKQANRGDLLEGFVWVPTRAKSEFTDAMKGLSVNTRLYRPSYQRCLKTSLDQTNFFLGKRLDHAIQFSSSNLLSTKVRRN